jgi:hypothetical protein
VNVNENVNVNEKEKEKENENENENSVGQEEILLLSARIVSMRGVSVLLFGEHACRSVRNKRTRWRENETDLFDMHLQRHRENRFEKISF